jgi:hypothetical protein
MVGEGYSACDEMQSSLASRKNNNNFQTFVLIRFQLMTMTAGAELRSVSYFGVSLGMHAVLCRGQSFF